MKAAVIFLALATSAFAQSGHWVTTWAAAQLKATPPPANAQAKQPPTPAQMVLQGFKGQSLRMVIPTTLAGSQARFEFSNAFGDKALTIGAARVALRDKDSAIKAGSDKALTFSGRPTAVIPPGASMVSDPVQMNIPALTDVAVSLYLPEETGSPTMHHVGLHTTYIAKEGDWTARANFDGADTSVSWYFLSAVHVLAPANAAAVVTFGDSITDGAVSTPNTNSEWPSVLARRIADAKRPIAVVNQGISGNRVLRDGAGPSALARFDRDVLAVHGAKWLVVLEGINDIGRAAGNNAQPADAATAEDIIAGHRQMIDRAHMHGIKAIGATLTPYEGAGYYSERGETIRQAVNQWIRTSGAYDAVVDFDAVIRDPANPKKMRADFNPGDNLHPNDKGYKAMGEALNLALFQ